MVRPMLLSATTLFAEGTAFAVGYVIGFLICFGLSLAIFLYVLKTFLYEQSRGQRRDAFDELPIDDEPQNETATTKGEKIPDWKIAHRVKATKAVAKFIAHTDNWYEPRYLLEITEEAVKLVKKAIERRTIQDVEPYVTEDFLEELRTEIKSLRKNRQRRIFSKILLDHFQLIHIAMPVGKANHTFTALLTLKSRDYIENEEEDVEEDEFERERRLDREQKLYQYQEFWSFRRSEKRWLVELVQPSADIDSILEAKNILAKIDFEEFAKDVDKETLQHVTGR